MTHVPEMPSDCPQPADLSVFDPHLLSQERWRPVVGFEGLYEVSDLGRVRSSIISRGRRSTVLKPGTKPGGWRYVTLYRADGSPVTKRVHQIVLTAFVGPAPNGHESSHEDGNASNNKLGNLLWRTHADNMALKKAHGTENSGERNGNAKLTDDDVMAIRMDARPRSTIAAAFGIRRETVHKLQTGQRWRHI